MKPRTVAFYVGLILVAVVLTPSHKKDKGPASTDVQSGGSPGADRKRIVESYGKLSLNFEANQGQSDPQVRFLSRGNGYTLFLTPTEAVLALRPTTASNPRQKPDRVHAALEAEAAQAQAPAVLRMKLIGSNSAPRLVGLDELPGKSNYFIGNDPKKWRTNVPNYSKVRYESVYPGVDLIYYGNQRQLEYDFVVAPGTDPDAITVRLEGAERIAIDPQGNLDVSIRGGELSFHKPVVYQEADGVRREIQSGYVLKEGNRFGFEVGTYDTDKPLVIDPTLAYSTYLGGSGNDLGKGIAVDGAGNAYVTGQTPSADFPTMNALQGFAGTDAFVTKFNAAGSALVYSTFLGGSIFDEAVGIAVDSTGSAYVTGETGSTDFPTTVGALDRTFNFGFDAFVTKLNPTGSALVYSTYLGGSNDDFGMGIAVDSAGNAYVAGVTLATDFPTTVGAFDTTSNGGNIGFDAFVTKLNPTGSALVYSTYLGGSDDDIGRAIAVDSGGNAYVTGETLSTNFPTANPIQGTSGGGGLNDAFVTKFNAAGSALVYSTYLGGSENDFGGGIAVDSTGSAYVTGNTGSTGFPTTMGAFRTACSGLGVCSDAFVTKFNAAGSALAYSTFLGGNVGSGFTFGRGIAVDSAGNAYVTGDTGFANFPTANPIQPIIGGFQDAFVTKFNPGGSALLYSTFLGGSGLDRAFGIAVDSGGNAYVTGEARSTNFPIASPIQAAFAGGLADAFVAKIGDTGLADLAVTKMDSPDPVTAGADVTYTVMVTNSGPDPATGVTLTDTLPGGVAFVSSTPSQGSCAGTSPVICDLGTLANAATATVTIVATTSAAGTITNRVFVRSNVGEPNTADNNFTETTTVTSGGGGTDADLRITKADSPDPVNVNANLTYTIDVTNLGPATATNVSMSDILPPGVTFQSLTSPAGWTCTTPAVGANGTVTCTNPSLAVSGTAVFTLVVTPGSGAAFNTSNTATVSATENDPDLANNSSTTSTQVNSVADVAVTKSGAPNPINLGAGNITYTVVVTNNGPGSASNVVLTDTLPAGVTFVSVMPGAPICAPAGGVVTCNIGALVATGSMTITIFVTPTAAGTLTNTASVAATETDPTPANNTATAMTTVNPSADLSVSKTDSPDPATVNSNLTYTITVNNTGPSAATNVTLTDALPANTTFQSITPAMGWTCTTPAVGAGGTVTCNIANFASGAPAAVFMIVVRPTAAGMLSNTATVASAVFDPSNANNSNTATTTVSAAPPDFSLSVSPTTATVDRGQSAMATVTVTPNPAPLANAVALDCTNLPHPLLSCLFSPASGTPNSNPFMSQLTIGTRKMPGVSSFETPRALPPTAVWFPLFALCLALLTVRGRARCQRLRFALVVLLLLAALLPQAACLGEGHARVPKGNYTITIRGVSGNTTHTTSLTLNVQ